MSEKDRERLARRFVVDFNYNSNHIEGNTLTYGQTEILLLFGKVIGEADVRDVQEMTASNVGLRMMSDEAMQKRKPLSQSFIRTMHKTLLREDYTVYGNLPGGIPTSYVIHAGQYKTRPNSVITRYGDRFDYASPEETPGLMNDLVDWYNAAEQDGKLSPVELAALFHYRYIRIHPFEDGNGRMSRLLTALLLHQEGYDICRYVSLESRINATRDRYYDALEASEEGWFDNTSDYTPFIEYFLGVLFLSYGEYDRRLASAAGRLGKSAAVRDIVLNVNMPVSKRDLMAMVPGVSESTVEAELRRMLDAGEAVKIGSTRGARYAAASRTQS